MLRQPLTPTFSRNGRGSAFGSPSTGKGVLGEGAWENPVNPRLFQALHCPLSHLHCPVISSPNFGEVSLAFLNLFFYHYLKIFSAPTIVIFLTSDMLTSIQLPVLSVMDLSDVRPLFMHFVGEDVPEPVPVITFNPLRGT